MFGRLVIFLGFIFLFSFLVGFDEDFRYYFWDVKFRFSVLLDFKVEIIIIIYKDF